MATTLKGFWTAEVARLGTEIGAIQAEDADQTNEGAVQRALSRWFSERLERLESHAGRARARVARATSQGEADAAAGELGDILGSIRATQALQRERELAGRIARVDQEHRVARLVRLNDRYEAAVTALAAAKLDEKEQAEWASRLQKPPFDDLPQAVADIRGSVRYKAVSDALDAIIPASLQDLAATRKALEDARRNAADDRYVHARDKVEDDLLARADASVRVRVKEARYLRARRALEEVVLRTPEILANAISFLQREVPAVAKTEMDELSAAEAGLATAVTAEKKVFEARAKFVTADARVAEWTLLEQSGGPGFDTGDFGSAKGVRTVAGTALESAEVGLSAAMRRKIDAWEARVPDTVWIHFLTFLEIDAELERLKDIDISEDYQQPVGAAETILTNALQTELDHAERLRKLTEERDRLEDVKRIWAGEHGARALGQVRGDSFTDQDILAQTDPAEVRAITSLKTQEPADAADFSTLMTDVQERPLTPAERQRLLELIGKVKEKIRVA